MSKKKTNEEFLQEVEKIFKNDIKILNEYNNATTKVSCYCNKCGSNFEKSPNALLSKKKACPNCGREEASKKHRISLEDYEARLHKTRPTLYVIGEYNGAAAPIKLKCNECKNIWELLSAWDAYDYSGNMTGCPFCDGEKIVKGLNSLGDLRSDLIQFFADKEEPFALSLHSHKKVNLRCPDCFNDREMDVASLVDNGFTCQVCGSSVSVPNRFIRRMLLNIKDQLDFYKFEFGKSNLLNGQAIDAYIETNGVKVAIEMQGRQHFEGPKSIYKNDFSKICEYDDKKRDMLKKLGIKEIEIECIKTNLQYIKERIVESELSQILQLNKVDWDEVFKSVYNSDIKEVCALYNQGIHIYKIAEQVGFSRNTIRTYLKEGNDLGWCNYIAIPKYNGPRKACKVEVLNDNKEVVYTFDSYNKAAIQLSNGEYSYNGYSVGLHAKDGKKYHEYYFRRVEN